MMSWLRTVMPLLMLAVMTSNVLAVPETVGVRITDVTPCSFSVVWMTDVAAEPEVEVYADSAMTQRVSQARLTTMPDTSLAVAEAARGAGIMKVRVTGLNADSKYFVRTLTKDPADPMSIAYSGIQEVSTTSVVVPYRISQDGSLPGFANDLFSFPVYIRPGDDQLGVGNLVILEASGSRYPISAFVGTGIAAPNALLDLNNIFGVNLNSLMLVGNERAVLRIYRGGTLSTLLHYRKLAAASGTVSVTDPVQGFFADINLDGAVDDADFSYFRQQFRTVPTDVSYNPDFNFFDDGAGQVNAQDFARFAKEFGRTNLQ